jgi:hypothetical protein
MTGHIGRREFIQSPPQRRAGEDAVKGAAMFLARCLSRRNLFSSNVLSDVRALSGRQPKLNAQQSAILRP